MKKRTWTFKNSQDLKDRDKKMRNGRGINEILNSDSLIGIFQYLETQDKLRIQTVCKNWYHLVGKFCWTGYKRIHIGHDFLFISKDTTNEEIVESFSINNNINVIFCIIKRCGAYVTDLTIEFNSKIDSRRLLKYIAKSCNNITSLRIKGYGKFFNFFIDAELSCLFRNNKKITSLNFNEIGMSGKCFSTLTNVKDLSAFKFEECYFNYPNHIYNLMSKMKNLKVFDLCIQELNTNKVLYALNKSSCIDLREFRITLTDEYQQNLLTNFLSKQKNLNILHCRSVSTKPTIESEFNFYDNLPKFQLQEMSINFDDFQPKKRIHRFVNLQFLHCHLIDLTDDIVKSLSMCRQLKTIILVASNNDFLTTDGAKKFGDLKSLEKLSIHVPANIDNILKALKDCQQLKTLNVQLSKLTRVSLTIISLVKNLRALRIPNVSGRTNVYLILINKLLYLKKLKIYDEKKLDLNMLHRINSIKINRKDENSLELQVSNEKLLSHEKTINELELLKVHVELRKIYL